MASEITTSIPKSLPELFNSKDKKGILFFTSKTCLLAPYWTLSHYMKDFAEKGVKTFFIQIRPDLVKNVFKHLNENPKEDSTKGTELVRKSLKCFKKEHYYQYKGYIKMIIAAHQVGIKLIAFDDRRPVGTEMIKEINNAENREKESNFIGFLSIRHLGLAQRVGAHSIHLLEMSRKEIQSPESILEKPTVLNVTDESDIPFFDFVSISQTHPHEMEDCTSEEMKKFCIEDFSNTIHHNCRLRKVKWKEIKGTEYQAYVIKNTFAEVKRIHQQMLRYHDPKRTDNLVFDFELSRHSSMLVIRFLESNPTYRSFIEKFKEVEQKKEEDNEKDKVKLASHLNASGKTVAYVELEDFNGGKLIAGTVQNKDGSIVDFQYHGTKKIPVATFVLHNVKDSQEVSKSQPTSYTQVYDD